MPELKTVAKPKVPSNKLSIYSELLKQVRRTLAQGRERAADAVEREKVRTSWETGKLIHEHILLNQERAEYGAQVIRKLSKDLGISDRELRYMVEFARTYPIWRTSAKLTWGHIQSLLAVNDDKKREVLAKRAVKEKWSLEETRREIRKLRTAKQITLNEFPSSAPLEAKRGTLHTYKIVLAKLGPWQGKPVIDLGFSNYFRPSGNFLFKENEIIKWNPVGVRSPRPKKSRETPPLQILKDAADSDLFTYKVYVDEVTDGDTIWVLIDLGLGVFTKQQLRLRGLDCPEIATRAGQAAKAFVERSLPHRGYPDPMEKIHKMGLRGGKSEAISPLSFPHAFPPSKTADPPLLMAEGGNPRPRSPIKTFGDDIIITSTKSDKYDRYLADIWIDDLFLNQKLIDKGLAVRVSE